MASAAAARDLGPTLQLGRRFVAGIVARDWAAVASCFQPDAHFLAVVANEAHPFREKTGGTDAAAQISRWFEDADQMELLESVVEPMVDRVRIVYRIREHDPDSWYVVEQLAYVTPGETGFARMNLACSGFRPVPD